MIEQLKAIKAQAERDELYARAKVDVVNELLATYTEPEIAETEAVEAVEAVDCDSTEFADEV